MVESLLVTPGPFVDNFEFARNNAVSSHSYPCLHWNVNCVLIGQFLGNLFGSIFLVCGAVVRWLLWRNTW